MCDMLIFRCKSTWNLESHKFLSQVLTSVRLVTAYCYWQSCKPLLPVSAKNKDCSTEIWRINKYYSLGEFLKHSSTIRHYTGVFSHLLWECSWITSRFVLSKKLFCLCPIFLVFSSKSLIAFVEQGKTKFERFFFLPFSVHQ